MGIVAALLALSAWGAEDAEKNAMLRYDAAHRTMSTADGLKTRNLPEQATELYQDALQSFQSLTNEFPNWQSSMVQYRIHYCQAQLDSLAVSEPPDEVPLPEPERVAAPAAMVRPVEPPAFGVDADEQHARRFEQEGNLKEAQELYASILREYPDRLDAVKGLCRCLLRLKNVNKARDLLHGAFLKDGSDAELGFLLGLVYCHDQAFDKAVRLLGRSVRKDMADPYAHAALGVALAGQGKLEVAYEEMKTALTLKRDIPEIYFNLAQLALRAKPSDVRMARQYYEESLRLGGEADKDLEKYLSPVVGGKD